MTSVTVVVPAYNEGFALAGNLIAIADHFSLHRAAGYDFRYLIVDDGSTDDTNAVALNFAKWRSNVTVLRHPHNRGLGAVLRTAFHHVETEYAIVLDADLSYMPTTGMELLEALEREGADIAVASPYAAGGSVQNVPPLRRILSREANRLLSFAAKGRYATFTCMVRAYRMEAIRRVHFSNDRMEAIPELMLSAIRQRLHIVEVPAKLHWSAERRNGVSRMRLSRVAAQTIGTTRLAFRHRPALWLGVPGLIPALLPAVVATLLLLHVSAATLALGTTITVVVQYASLAIIAGQAAPFLTRTLLQRRHTITSGTHR